MTKRALGGATATAIPDNEEVAAGGVDSRATTSASGPPAICSASREESGRESPRVQFRSQVGGPRLMKMVKSVGSNASRESAWRILPPTFYLDTSMVSSPLTLIPPFFLEWRCSNHAWVPSHPHCENVKLFRAGPSIFQAASRRPRPCSSDLGGMPAPGRGMGMGLTRLGRVAA